MTKRKLTLRVPTHELVADGVVYAHIRCGKGGSAAMKLLSTGEVARSASYLFDCDLLMGHWRDAAIYCFSDRADHIPEHAVVQRIPQDVS
jgi:hypothetical protein